MLTPILVFTHLPDDSSSEFYVPSSLTLIPTSSRPGSVANTSRPRGKYTTLSVDCGFAPTARGRCPIFPGRSRCYPLSSCSLMSIGLQDLQLSQMGIAMLRSTNSVLIVFGICSPWRLHGTDTQSAAVSVTPSILASLCSRAASHPLATSETASAASVPRTSASRQLINTSQWRSSSPSHTFEVKL